MEYVSGLDHCNGLGGVEWLKRGRVGGFALFPLCTSAVKVSATYISGVGHNLLITPPDAYRRLRTDPDEKPRRHSCQHAASHSFLKLPFIVFLTQLYTHCAAIMRDNAITSLASEAAATWRIETLDEEQTSAIPGKIEVQRMNQTVEVKGQDEDWTGKTSTALRRKLQNRLNQRASRMFDLADIVKAWY